MSRTDAVARAAAAARQLAEALADLARERERAPDQEAAYDSMNLPPRTSRRRFAELCRSGCVPGAHREGRAWICSRDAWHASRIRGAPKNRAPNPLPSLAERADALLRRGGLRLLPTARASGEDASSTTSKGHDATQT
jgi:hypothetical protein